MQKYLLLSILFFFSVKLVLAQNKIKLTGILQNKQTQKPLLFVSLQYNTNIFTIKKQVITDSIGRFTVEVEADNTTFIFFILTRKVTAFLKIQLI